MSKQSMNSGEAMKIAELTAQVACAAFERSQGKLKDMSGTIEEIAQALIKAYWDAVDSSPSEMK
jgi:hypothetical protein